MNIAATQYTSKTKSLEIYFSGCDGSCKGCHNKELWDYSVGSDYREWLDSIKNKVGEFKELESINGLKLDWIWILGGEPLLQPTELMVEFLDFLKGFNKPIVLFTRFSLGRVPKSILDRVDYVKCGRYDDKVKDYSNMYGIEILSNQYVYKRGKHF